MNEVNTFKERREEWCRRLESGEYKQGKGMLRTINDEYCCLGVLTELAMEKGLDIGVISTDKHYSYKGEEHASTSTCLVEVRNWIGLKNQWGSYYGGSLASDNDAGRTFPEIAEIIRAEPPGLFHSETEVK